MRPTKQQAEEAVKTLLSYIGEDVNREGLIDTPYRVIKSYNELFAGYNDSVDKILDRRFTDVSEYNNVILLKSIDFNSTCEHHMLPFSGTVDIAYIPNNVVLGISKLARLVDMFSKRLQIQEKMTADIAKTLQERLQPKGVAIKVIGSHSCMVNRGVMKTKAVMESTHFTGIYEQESEKRQEFFQMIR